MNTYTRRRITALAVLVLLVWGAVALARSLTGGGSGQTAARTTTTTARADTSPAAIARRATVPVLCWHQVRPITASDSEWTRTYIVTPETLDAQLAALSGAGYTTITGEQYAAYLTKGTALPDKPVLLTFDDGTIGQYSNVLPLLQQRGMVATFFPMTVVLGKKDWVTEGMLQELVAAGMSVGSHTWDHQEVPKLHTAEQYDIQFNQPKAELERITGQPVTLFAYPFGLWNRAAFPRLRAAGYTVAFQLSEPLDARQPLMTVRRMVVPEWSGDEMLRHIAETFPAAEAAPGATTTTAS